MFIDILVYFLLTIHVLASILLVLTVLIQRPKSEGLGAAFGGGMTESLFGAGTTDALTKISIWLVGIFFAITLTLAVIFSHKARWQEGDPLAGLSDTPAEVDAAADASTTPEVDAPEEDASGAAAEGEASLSSPQEEGAAQPTPAEGN